MRGEFHLIERLKRLIPRSLQGPFGIGDDAAVFPAGGGGSFLFTTDVIVEGVDFRLGQGGARPEQIGHKALAVNLSDCAAMGGTPLAFVSAFGIPKSCSEPWTERIAKGMVRLARRFKVSWVGGDISRSERLFISIALLGRAKTGEAIFRKGARSGDQIFVTGSLGGSLQGKHLVFAPRIQEARFLAERFRPSAMIDISDGFVQDLGHILSASKVGAMVELDRIPVSSSVREKASRFRRRALEKALTDGEDFELLGTVSRGRWRKLEKAWPRRFPGLPLIRVGEIRPSSEGLVWREGEKQFRQLWFRKKGFTHF